MLKAVQRSVLYSIYKAVLNPVNRVRNSTASGRKLEIGPGAIRLPGFETLNILGGKGVDYLYDAARRLPFKDGTFSLVYASHVLEHVPWYRTQACLNEWARVIEQGGALEIWVPDGLKIADAFVKAELHKSDEFLNDAWDRFNKDRDACLWANGRFFSYGDGTGAKNDPNWHMAMFSERHLTNLLHRAGFSSVRRLEPQDVRGYDHGWINLGLRATK